MRRLLCLILLAASGAALAQAPAAPAPQAPELSPEDLRTVFAEMQHTHDGFLYTLYLLRYGSEEQARRVWAQLQEPRFSAQRFEQLFKGIKPTNFYLFALYPALRARVVNLYEGERSGVIRSGDAWYIAEVAAIRPAITPSLEAAAPHLPRLVVSGALPSAEQLRTEPQLRRRTLANAIQSVEKLREAPADFDPNARLSTENTLLLRAISQRKLDLVEELLKRGASPNACARKFCPLQLAIYGGSAPVVDALLKAGADANQRDPAIGVAEGPLAAAAYKGEVDLAGRLLAAGALLNGHGRESPLMAAAGAAQRPMVEFLVSKGADLFALSSGPGLQRTALDYAERSKNPELAAWLRGAMLARAKESGQYAWEGWIEQDGRRLALDKAVTLKRAPFRIVVRMKPERVFYAAASTDRRLFDEFRAPARDGALFFGGSIAFEDNDGKSAFLVVHEPEKPGERWGGSQAWWQNDKGTRFTAVADTPQGREYAREIRDLIVLGAGDKRSDVPVAQYGGQALFLALGTRVRMTSMHDEVFDGRTVEIRFAP